MHDEPKMPTGNLGTQVAELGDDRRATTAGKPVLGRRCSDVTEADWLAARHERHMQARQFSGAPLTDWPVPADMRT